MFNASLLLIYWQVVNELREKKNSAKERIGNL